MTAASPKTDNRRVLALTLAVLMVLTLLQLALMLRPQEAMAAPSPLSTWYLAEGSNAWGFSTTVHIQNPNSQDLTGRVTFMTTTGPVSIPDISLKATSYTEINTWELMPNQDFSTVVECLEGWPIAVERSMGWLKPGSSWATEGHSSIGVTAPSTNWLLPEGSSQWGFETWLLIQNPQVVPVQCTLSYMLDSGQPVVKVHTIPANSRQTFGMEAEIGKDDASISVSAPDPVIAERAMYRYNRMMGHESIGTTAPNNDFYLAEGSNGWGFTTYVLVQNPMNVANDIRVTFMNTNGTQVSLDQGMGPNSRWTIDTSKVLPGQDFSTHIQGSQPIAAERAMYWSSSAPNDGACHDSIGLSAPHMSFYLPSAGVSRADDQLDTWTLVQNPNPFLVTVEVTYMFEDGSTQVFQDDIPATSRRTYEMGARVPSDDFVGASVMVQSLTPGMPIMAENSIYTGSKVLGTNTIGGFSD